MMNLYHHYSLLIHGRWPIFIKFTLVLFFASVISCTQKPAKIIDRSKIQYGKFNAQNREKYKNIRQENSQNSSDRQEQMVSSRDEVVVMQGDSLYSIARKHDVRIRELIEANNLRAPYALKSGEVIKIPKGKFHEIREGETLYSVSRSFGMRVDELIALNSLKFPFTVHTGDKLRVSEIIKNSAEPTETNNKLSSIKTKNGEIESSKIAIKQNPKIDETSQESGIIDKTLEKMSHFSWPIRGKIISKFGPKSGGLYNDGINIKANAGDNILAAEEGVVAYVGNELKGYGNLIIVKHSGGWLTAYAHLKDSLVQKDQKVKKGQKIGTVGSTGKVAFPQLYFGLRKGNDAVNPENYLRNIS